MAATVQYNMLTKLSLLKKSDAGGSKYHCPVCGGGNFHVKHSTGAYKCYSNECAEADIRRAIDELEGKPQYEKRDKWTKPARAKSKKTYYYPDRAGEDLAKVDRIDNGDGSKSFYQGFKDGHVWKSGMPEEIRKHLPIYNYAAVQKAIASNQRIWVVEGESAAEVLIKMGIPATTTIGGSGGFMNYGDYRHDLKGASLVLCPDRDTKGIAYMAQWAEMFTGQIAGYYLSGARGLWANLQSESDGMDIADAVADFSYTAAQLADQVISPEEFLKAIAPVEPKKNPSAGIVTDLEKASLMAVLALKERRPSIDIFPDHFADMLRRDALKQNIDAVSYTAYLLPVVSSLMGITGLALTKSFVVPNIIWSILIQKSGGGKTRAEVVIKKQILKWEVEATERYKQQKESYDEAIRRQSKNSKGVVGVGGMAEDVPRKPSKRKYLISATTPEAVLNRLAEQVDEGVVLIRDELKGLFGSLSKYSKGGDSDAVETLLELWNGSAVVVDRVKLEDCLIADRTRLSLAGGIQPGALKSIFSSNDDQGLLARFLPIMPETLEAILYDGELELERELPALYHWIKSQDWDGLYLDNDAAAAFKDMYSHLGNLNIPHSGIHNWASKAAGHVGRVSMVIHAIACYYGGHAVCRAVNTDTLTKAYLFILDCLDNVYRIVGDLPDSDDGGEGLSPVLRKILAKAEQHPEGITLADLYRNMNTLRTQADREKKPIAEFTKNLCEELVELGLGNLEQSEKGIWRFFVC